MTAAMARTNEVRAALDRVTDPELDESVVALGFITAIEIVSEAEVTVNFRLPTYWCAANFSYLMASDMRDAVAALPWVAKVAVRLDEHMFVDEINDGVAGQREFFEAFPDESRTNLDDIRRNFGLKSLERRQEALLRHLLAQGHSAETILALDPGGLARLTLDEEGASLRTRYLERLPLLGDVHAAFLTREGAPITPADFPLYLRRIRRVGLNAEFNGALCRGLLAARYNETPCGEPPAEPELIDFVLAAAHAKPISEMDAA